MSEVHFAVRDYDLDATLRSGQTFRWRRVDDAWEGVVSGHWCRLRRVHNGIAAETVSPTSDWRWLGDYLQVQVNLAEVLATFPRDPALEAAVAQWRGLRLLRQDIWECLASFILSSTKQIVQIEQVIARLCERFGEPVAVPAGRVAPFSFPSAVRLAQAGERELRACRMGFRAAYLRETARRVAAGDVDLGQISRLPLATARAELQRLPGVGPKIAECVLLFAGGFPAAFPIDVWIARALREIYFAGEPCNIRELADFAAAHFGPFAGYAQQYLFHSTRLAGHRHTAEATPKPAM